MLKELEMSDVVAKDFKTISRKFKAGDSITESDFAADENMSYADRKAAGFIAAAAVDDTASKKSWAKPKPVEAGEA